MAANLELMSTDILAWCRSLPNPDRAPDTRYPTPPACPGWTLQLAASRQAAHAWRIVARRGPQVVVADKLTASDVEAFNPTERWNRP